MTIEKQVLSPEAAKQQRIGLLSPITALLTISAIDTGSFLVKPHEDLTGLFGCRPFILTAEKDRFFKEGRSFHTDVVEVAAAFVVAETINQTLLSECATINPGSLEVDAVGAHLSRMSALFDNDLPALRAALLILSSGVSTSMVSGVNAAVFRGLDDGLAVFMAIADECTRTIKISDSLGEELTREYFQQIRGSFGLRIEHITAQAKSMLAPRHFGTNGLNFIQQPYPGNGLWTPGNPANPFFPTDPNVVPYQGGRNFPNAGTPGFGYY